MNCPNYHVCSKQVKHGLKVCTSCFWRFKNEILEFKTYECPRCCKTGECLSFGNVTLLCMSALIDAICKLCEEPKST